MTENSVTEIPIASIRMTGRYRKDYGDIATLASSIEQLGLLQPIGVTASNKLVFGQRRVLAFQRLGRSTIPARVIDVPALVLAEHAENEIRKDFTPLERVAIGEAVEAELKAMGERRGRPKQEGEGQGGLVEKEIPGNCPEFQSGETREIAARKAGFGSDRTYLRAKAVAHHATPELAQAMDQGHVAISTAARLVSAPVEVQRKAAADPKKAVELAKSASQQKSTEIKAAAVAIQKREMQTEMAEMRALRPARAESTPSKESAPHPKDPVFDTVLPNGRNIANGDPKALWLWGWMLEYEDRFLREAPTPEALTSNFLDFMDNDSIRLIPQITSYLNKVLESIHASAS